ncbi:hypothetical protein C5167_044135 [Papaver somniferum]|uniref:Uncharacterized protein n=1 Tax=Papaver somniferum TaxID=3469 RepID=A0A4Y7LA81_PAPSO|nr:hypothetical protein C5167_044135 [Papaver somniferum]
MEGKQRRPLLRKSHSAVSSIGWVSHRMWAKVVSHWYTLKLQCRIGAFIGLILQMWRPMD